MLWKGTLAAVREAVAVLAGAGSVQAIGLSGQMHGSVLYDACGEVIEPVINWQDKRCDRPLARYAGKTTIQAMVERLGGQGFEDLGIDVMASGFLGATLFYIKENEPVLFDHIAHVTLPTDVIRGRLLGQNDYATDQTNAFGTGLFNTRLNCWHAEFIQKLDLPLALFPEVHDSAAVAGTLSAQVAAELGLAPGIPVIYGGGDNQMSMLGSGLASPQAPALINIGTAAQISRVTGAYRKIAGVDTRSFFGGSYAWVGASLGGGVSYEWLRDQIRHGGDQDMDYPRMDALAARVPPGADGLRFCTGPSRQDPRRQLGFYGEVPPAPSVGQRARAVMEGVLMDVMAFYRLLGDDPQPTLLGAGKGLQKSRVWAQMAADMFGKPLRITDFENAVFGAALLAAYGAGQIQDLGEAVRAIRYREVAPDLVASKMYQEIMTLVFS
jgi:xylulokinase